jgi:RecA-family ATPase
MTYIHADTRQSGRLRILSVDDLLSLPPRDYLVKGWLSPSEISLIIGAKNVRKTFLALYVDYAIAQGRSVFGRRVKQSPALYVVAEGEAGIARRVKALADRYGRCDAFHVIAQPIDLLRCDASAGDLHDLIQAAITFILTCY